MKSPFPMKSALLGSVKLLPLCLCAVLWSGLHAQIPKLAEPIEVEGAFITKRGALVQGRLTGNLAALDASAIVTLDLGASVSGDLVVPAEKPAVGPVLPDPMRVAAPSARTTITNRGGGIALKGSIRAAAGFDLPRVLAPSAPVKPGSTVIEGAAGSPADFSRVGNLTLRQPGASVVLPPGSYGDLVVAQGTLLLGSAGNGEPSRYEFRTIDVQAGGTVALAGPVVATVANGATLRGTAGHAAAPFWFDLRVAAGEVLVAGPGALYAFLSAPQSKVTVAGGGALVGGAASDQLEVANGAEAKMVAPDWSGTADEITRPRFPHKALRLQSSVPELKAGFRHSYGPGVSYIDDVPYLMLAEGKRPLDHPLADYEAHRAFFEACRTLFVNTGFDRAVLVLASYSADPIQQPGTTRNLALSREQFLAMLEAVAGQGSEAANLRTVSRHPGRLEEFQALVLATALPPTPGR